MPIHSNLSHVVVQLTDNKERLIASRSFCYATYSLLLFAALTVMVTVKVVRVTAPNFEIALFDVFAI